MSTPYESFLNIRKSSRTNQGTLPSHLNEFEVIMDNSRSSSPHNDMSGEDNLQGNGPPANLEQVVTELTAQIASLRSSLEATQSELMQERCTRDVSSQSGISVSQTESSSQPTIISTLPSSSFTQGQGQPASQQNVAASHEIIITKQPVTTLQTTLESSASCSGGSVLPVSSHSLPSFSSANTHCGDYSFQPCDGHANQLKVAQQPAIPSYDLRAIYSQPSTTYSHRVMTHTQSENLSSQHQNQSPAYNQANFGSAQPRTVYGQPYGVDSQYLQYQQNFGQTLAMKTYDLPEFSGRPEEWPMFFATFRQSTSAYGYSNLQNMFRLQKSLKGAAKESVQCLLLHPDNVEKVLELLEFRFGRPEYLINSQLQKMKEIMPIYENKLDQIIQFSTKVQNLTAFLDTIKGQPHLTNPTLIEELVSKLPMSKRFEWAKHAAAIEPYATIKDFNAWLSSVAKYVSLITSQPVYSCGSLQGTAAVNSRPSHAQVEKRSARNVMLHVQNIEKKQCYICTKTGHSIVDCSEFLKLKPTARWERVKKNRLCFSCLRAGHNLSECRSKSQCGIRNCQKSHNPLLHDNVKIDSTKRLDEKSDTSNSSKDDTVSVLNCHQISSDQTEVLFRVIPVKLFGPETVISTYALLDEASSVTMIDEQIANELQLDGEAKQLKLQWVGGNRTTEPSRTVSLEISGILPKHQRFRLEKVDTIRNIGLPLQTLKLSEIHSRYHSIKHLPITEYSSARPTILIGTDYCHLGVPKKTIKCHGTGPFAAQTKLGWIIYGPITSSERYQQNQSHVLLSRKYQSNDYEELDRTIKEYFSIENFGVKVPETPLESKEDTRARMLLENTTIRVDKRFETGLLWKDENIEMPDSRQMAMNRLITIENKMKRDAIYAENYERNIMSYLEKGYARKLSVEEASQVNARTWYLPHFEVKNPNKPNKFRLVFDAAAAVKGISLNSVLMKGPDQYTPLTSVLFKFRMGEIAVCGDIKEMFHQVMIKKADQDSQRFLWRHGDASKPVESYVMQVMTFGATCSPCSAQFVKNKNTREHEQQNPVAAKAIIDKHYVDDYLNSFSSGKEAIEVTKAVIKIHQQAGFELCSFVSNSQEVLKALHGRKVSHLKFDKKSESTTTVEKILGMFWNPQRDVFQFEFRFHRIKPEVLSLERKPSKREVVSVTMSIFDPFGILANFVINAKLLIQDLWKCGIGWDACIPESLHARWAYWITELHNIKNCNIPRCYSPHLLTSDDVQIHIFAEASESAYAAVGYWRIKLPDGRFAVAFIAGKTKCAPLKLISVPRLELQAAVLAARLKSTIHSSHNVIISRCFLWTDSTTVYSWIRSDLRRYKPFVAHRVAEILDSSDISSWRWVPTKLNVADDATRSNYHHTFDPNSRWLSGPEFLSNPEDLWPKIKSNEIDDCPQEEIRPRQFVLHAKG